MVARVEDVAEPGSFQLLDVEGENVILVRGRDDVIRAFYNVCRHRGTAVEERVHGLLEHQPWADQVSLLNCQQTECRIVV